MSIEPRSYDAESLYNKLKDQSVEDIARSLANSTIPQEEGKLSGREISYYFNRNEKIDIPIDVISSVVEKIIEEKPGDEISIFQARSFITHHNDMLEVENNPFSREFGYTDLTRGKITVQGDQVNVESGIKNISGTLQQLFRSVELMNKKLVWTQGEHNAETHGGDKAAAERVLEKYKDRPQVEIVEDWSEPEEGRSRRIEQDRPRRPIERRGGVAERMEKPVVEVMRSEDFDRINTIFDDRVKAKDRQRTRPPP